MDYTKEDLIALIQTLIDHAKETYPHFESVRGQADIQSAQLAVDLLKKL